MIQQSASVERSADETVAWVVFAALAFASLVLASLFAGISAGGGVLTAVAFIAAAIRRAHV